tara:strand:+ start:17897 stop:19825 length:1929 start_codon:yes stop_codon:yes gene_type:complete
MNNEKQLLEELQRFNQITDYTPGEPTVISEEKSKINKTLNEQVSTIPGTGSDLSQGIGATPKKGGWGSGLPKWMKGANFVKVGSLAGLGGLATSEASADPGVQAVGNIVGFGGTGAAVGTMIAPGIGTAVGALIGGAAGAIMSSWSEDNQTLAGGDEAFTLSMNNELWEAFDTIKKKEDLEGLEIISSSEAEAIADKLLTAMYGGGTNENRIIDAIDLAPSLVDVSRVHDKFGIEKGMWPSSFRGTLTEWVEDELTSSELNRFKNQLKNKPVLIYEGKEINTIQDWEELLSTEQEPSDDDKRALAFAELWKNYPCVVATAQSGEYETKWSDDDKQVTLRTGDAMARFSYTGKYRYKGPASDGKVTPVGTYSCSGDELSFDELDDSDMTIKESRKLSNILKSRKVIKEQNNIEFGQMVLTLPEPVATEKETETTDDGKKTVKKTTTVYTTAPSLADVVAGKAQIKQGHMGDSVRAIQSIVGAPVDGKFGPVTYTAVRAYQNGNGLSVTGIVDQQTARLITNAGGSKEKVTTIKKTEEVATDKDEENVNLVAYEMEQTNSEIVDNQINQLNKAIANQPTKQKCIQLIGTAAAGCKMGVKNINKNSLAQCYNSYNFGFNKVGRSGKSRRVKKCYGLKGRGNVGGE